VRPGCCAAGRRHNPTDALWRRDSLVADLAWRLPAD